MKNRRNSSLDVLKGICIIFIIITHYSWAEAERLQYAFPFWIDMAVPIFMIISGYVYAISFRTKGIDGLKKAYGMHLVLDKIIRYTVPFAIAYTIEKVIDIMSGEYSSLTELIFEFVTGGKGPGSYYYPILIQFIFVYPVIYIIISRYKQYGMFLLTIVNVVYEVVQCTFEMSGETYRLLIFRYIMVIAAGCYMAFDGFKTINLFQVVMFVTGTGFILLYRCIGVTPQVFKLWTGTCFCACMYVIPLVAILIHRYTIKCTILEHIGKASYNIFLVQMVFYPYGAKYIYHYVEMRGVQLLLNLLICLGVGVIFYYVETPVTRLIIRYTRSSKAT